MPLEELLFAVFFGMYWSAAYEHYTWKQTVATHKATEAWAMHSSLGK